MSQNTNAKPRVNFASVKNPYPFPDFLEVQLKSFRDFLQLDTPPENRKNEGLYKVFSENFPIADTRNNFVLEFLDYYIDPPRYSIEECFERGLTYSVPLKAKLICGNEKLCLTLQPQTGKDANPARKQRKLTMPL